MLILLFAFVIPAILQNARTAVKITPGKERGSRSLNVFN